MNISPFKTVLLVAVCTVAAQSYAQISVGIDIAPPALPDYAQPAMPGEGYLWTPGYWGWDPNNNDYYWVPGTWVQAPYSGALWTPGYWGYDDGHYAWNGGYWGMHIGYYGGINYGYGYTGVGYQGGYWNRGEFRYNRNVNNVGDVHVTNAYSANINVTERSRISFNGGNRGVQMTSSKNDQIINHMPHQQATAPQVQHESDARAEPQQRLSGNHGMPKVAATPQPSSFQSPHVEPARAQPEPHAAPEARQPQRPQQQQQPQRPQQQQQPQHSAPHAQAARAEPAHAAPERKEERR